MTGSPTEPPIATTSNITRAKCPTCGKPTDVGFRPFCSKRCADVDLNRWFTGAYAVPSEKEHLDELDTPEAD